jgi:predicted ester cyclase
VKTGSHLLAVPMLGLLVTAIGCSDQTASDEIEQRNMAIMRQAHADLAAGNLEAFKAVISPDYRRHCQAMPPEFQEIQGTQEFFAFIEDFMVAVPVYEDSLSNMIASGDIVAYISTLKGTQTGPMGEFPPSGKSFTLTNIIMQRLENGKVVETWVSWDNVAFLSQLGFMPPPKETTEEK